MLTVVAVSAVAGVLSEVLVVSVVAGVLSEVSIGQAVTSLGASHSTPEELEFVSSADSGCSCMQW